jgi:hypothetical protein
MTDQQQPAPGQMPQQPKKKHTVRNVLLAIIGVFILFVGGCFALVGGAANEIDKAIQEEEANDKPVAVEEGKAFTHDGFEVTGGWKVANDGLGGATIKGLSVTNTADEERTALLSFRFYKGKTNLAEVECSSNQLQADESSSLDCFSTDTKFPKGYNEIRVADSF